MRPFTRVGVVGLGKLGLPVALAIQAKGWEVLGCEQDAQIIRDINDRKFLAAESSPGPEFLQEDGLTLVPDISRLVWQCDLIFLAVQTPHLPAYEGTTKLGHDRADFDYTYLKKALQAIALHAETIGKRVMVAVISTCLPGTYKRELRPLVNDYVSLLYNPSFIAMGTVIKDFYDPEFLLIGYDKEQQFGAEDAFKLAKFYETIHTAPLLLTDITTAEAIKVSYNTFITAKTVLANTWAEIAHKTGANVDHIFDAWSLSHDRLVSDKYLRAGMGDGGGCHPRDNIALSWLARELDLSHDLFEDLIVAREDHTYFLANLLQEQGGTICLLGRAFKPETDIETGSPAVLLSRVLEGRKITHVHVEELPAETYDTYFIATQHERYADINFPKGSVVFDPFGFIEDQPEVRVIRIGRP